MKPELTAEEQGIRTRHRQRLLGAVVLVGVAVLLLPVLLDHVGRPKQAMEVIPTAEPQRDSPNERRISSAEALPGAPVIAPQNDSATAASSQHPPASKAAEPPASGRQSAALVATAEPIKMQTKPKSGPETGPSSASRSMPQNRPNPTPNPTPSPESTPKAPGTWLQVGVFGHQDKVDRLVLKLKKLGFNPAVEPFQVPEGIRWRVRVGPFESPHDTIRAFKRLEALGVKPMKVS